MRKRYLALFLSLCLAWTLFPAPSRAENEDVLKQVDAVLVYNPMLSLETELYTGTFLEQKEEENASIATVKEDYTSGLHVPVESKRTPESLEEGERSFWVCINLENMSYAKRTFSLTKTTDHAMFWVAEADLESVSQDSVDTLAERYESIIYPTLTETFGAFRDLQGDGRIHVLLYDMNSAGVCGFFDRYDLYTLEEIAVIDPNSDAYNALPIININAKMAESSDLIASTVAHEFQHLIHMSAVLESEANASLLGTEKQTSLWLNEAFSMEAEELCFPQSVEEQGYLEQYSTSPRIQKGQSLYDFTTSSTDVGAYGQSFLFAQYVKEQVGTAAFSTVLEYWKTATNMSSLTDANAMFATLTDAFSEQLEGIVYEPFVAEALINVEDVALSKWNLAYRLSLLTKTEEGIFHHPNAPEPPYYTGTGTYLEGGGAVIVQTKGKDFTVPADADAGVMFFGIRDGAIAEAYTVPETENGFYVISVSYKDKNLAFATDKTEGIVTTTVAMHETIALSELTTGNTNGYLWYLEGDSFSGYSLWNVESEERLYLGRIASGQEELCVSGETSRFRLGKFSDGRHKMQFDGTEGRAVLYSSTKHGYGYFPSGYFMNESIARPDFHPVSVLYGDVDRNNHVEAMDAALILRGTVGLVQWNEVERLCADCNQDLKVNASDAATLLRSLVSGKEA